MIKAMEWRRIEGQASYGRDVDSIIIYIYINFIYIYIYILQKLIQGEDIVKYTYVRTQKIKWWGHLNRMEVKLVNKIADWNPLGFTTKGRPKNRWRDEMHYVILDLKKLKLRNWIQFVKGRKAWNDLVQKTNPM
jgi:hypothetical protein